MVDAQAVKFAATWSENAAQAVSQIRTLEELDAWILANRYKLADVERANAPAWDLLRAALHHQDGEIRECIGQRNG